MRGGTDFLGYTIIEVMIFLAISGLMFIMAVVFVSGKQSIAEFRQGINDINTQVQQTIDDVSNGFYPSNSNFTCTSGASGLSIGSGATTQGANGGTSLAGNGCVFMGKVIQFGDATTAATAYTNYNIYTVAGSQYANGGIGPATPTCFNATLAPCVNAAETTAVDPNSPTVHNNVNLTQYNTFEWGLNVKRMFECNDQPYTVGTPCSNPVYINAVGFFTSFGNYDTNNNLQPGAQSITTLVYLGNIDTTTNTQNNTVGHINDTGGGGSSLGEYAILPGPPPYDHNPVIIVCFDSGSSQYGTLTIGGDNSQRLATSVQIYSGTTNWNQVGC